MSWTLDTRIEPTPAGMMIATVAAIVTRQAALRRADEPCTRPGCSGHTLEQHAMMDEAGFDDPGPDDAQGFAPGYYT